MESLLQILANWSGQRTDWGKITGSIIILTFLTAWTYTVWKHGWIDPGPSIMAGMWGIYVFLGRKETPPPSTPTT